jgi:hypothetical protein
VAELFPLLVGLSVVAAECVASVLGTMRDPSALVAPLAATSLLAVVQWPKPHAAHALWAVAGGSALGAFYVLVAVPFVWTA